MNNNQQDYIEWQLRLQLVPIFFFLQLQKYYTKSPKNLQFATASRNVLFHTQCDQQVLRLALTFLTAIIIKLV